MGKIFQTKLSGFRRRKMPKRILFFPLDDRPPNYQHVARLAKMAKQSITFVRKLMKAGNFATGIISLDGLVYGGLVPSRRMEMAKHTALERLQQIRTWRRDHSNAHVYVFGTILRSFPRKGSWMRREVRERNHAILLQAIRMVLEGVIHTLLIGVEDADPKGLAVPERRAIEKMIFSLGLQKRVFLVDGADELGQMLFARFVLENYAQTVEFIPHFSDPRLRTRIARYESIPILSNVRAHAALFSAFPQRKLHVHRVPLFVHIHPGRMRDLHLETVREECPTAKKDNRWIRHQRKPVAIADVAYANGACPDFALRLCEQIYPKRYICFTAWNTAGNTVGGTMAWAAIACASKIEEKLHVQYLTERILDDFLYQSLLRRTLTGPHERKMLRRQLREEWRVLFPRQKKFALRDLRVSFPWHRLFEIELEAILDSA